MKSLLTKPLDDDSDSPTPLAAEGDAAKVQLSSNASQAGKEEDTTASAAEVEQSSSMSATTKSKKTSGAKVANRKVEKINVKTQQHDEPTSVPREGIGLKQKSKVQEVDAKTVTDAQEAASDSEPEPQSTSSPDFRFQISDGIGCRSMSKVAPPLTLVTSSDGASAI